MADNLAQLVHRQTAEFIASARRWFEREHDRADQVSRQIRLPLRAVTGILAALSPQVRWETTWDLTRQVIGIRVRDPMIMITQVARLRTFKATNISVELGASPATEIAPEALPYVLPTRSWAQSGRNLEKAFQIAFEDADPLTILRGPKIRSLYKNLMEPAVHCPVAVDRHMAMAAAGGDSLLAELLLNHPRRRGLSGSYALVVEATYRAADRCGLAPHELQSVVWCAATGE